MIGRMERRRGNRPLSQVEIEEMIASDLEMLEEATEDYRVALEEEADAESDLSELVNRLYLSANGTVRDKEAYSKEQSADYLRKHLRAVAKSKGLREILRKIHTRIDALRSLNSNVRAQV